MWLFIYPIIQFKSYKYIRPTSLICCFSSKTFILWLNFKGKNILEERHYMVCHKKKSNVLFFCAKENCECFLERCISLSEADHELNVRERNRPSVVIILCLFPGWSLNIFKVSGELEGKKFLGGTAIKHLNVKYLTSCTSFVNIQLFYNLCVD